MPTDRERTAFHEAGHGVTALEFGIYIEILSIEPDPVARTHGRVTAEVLVRYVDESQNPSTEIIEGHLVNDYAGFAAQRRFDPTQPESDALAEADDDFERAGEWSDLFDRAQILRRAKSLVAERWGEIELVARALLLKDRIDAEELDRVSGLNGDNAKDCRRILREKKGWTESDFVAVATGRLGERSKGGT